MALKPCMKVLSGFILLAFVIYIMVKVLFFYPISPDSLQLPKESSAYFLPKNNLLQGVTKLGEGFVNGPEDIGLERSEGRILVYTATRDGWIKRLHRNGSWENWKLLDSQSLLGITLTKEGHLIVCDAVKGLLRVDEDGVTVLTSHVEGSKIRFADDVIEGSDGSLYFSVASTKFEYDDWFLDILEAKPHGQLLKYEPSSKKTSILLEDLAFANGVALSKDQDFLVVCESWKFRCLKYWLKGENNGKTDIFIRNLPVAPDNINLAPDGSFWIALVQITPKGLEFVHTSKLIKKIIATFPRLTEIVKGKIPREATVVNVAAEGKITKRFDDSEGKVMSFVNTAVEFEDHLYLASLSSNFIGKLPLQGAN